MLRPKMDVQKTSIIKHVVSWVMMITWTVQTNTGTLTRARPCCFGDTRRQQGHPKTRGWLHCQISQRNFAAPKCAQPGFHQHHRHRHRDEDSAAVTTVFSCHAGLLETWTTTCYKPEIVTGHEATTNRHDEPSLFWLSELRINN